MSMVISRHSPIISWSKQSANFQSFTELDGGGIQNNSISDGKLLGVNTIKALLSEN